MTVSIFRDGLYAGKNVFITGGSSGINLGIAEAFVQAGARVGINGRNADKLALAVKGLKALGGTAFGYSADVRDYAALDAALAQAEKDLGPLDVLVCGAAGNFPAPAVGISSNGFKAVLDIDVLGTFHACRAAFDRLRKPGACILNITAPQGSAPFIMQTHVCAAKAGVDMITRTLAVEWGGLGIRVNAISPGPIVGTEGMARLAGGPDVEAKLAQLMPLQRLGQKSDVAQMALFLCSDAASFVTGGIFPCDGGQTLLGGSLFNQVMMGS